MINKVQLIGNLGKDPEIKNTQSGKKVANFSLATSEQKDQTTWHNITVWDKLADIVEKYLKKGASVYVEGRINYREHEGKYYTDIVCYNLKMLGKKDSGSTQHEEVPPAGNETSDDLPFN